MILMFVTIAPFVLAIVIRFQAVYWSLGNPGVFQIKFCCLLRSRTYFKQVAFLLTEPNFLAFLKLSSNLDILQTIYEHRSLQV